MYRMEKRTARHNPGLEAVQSLGFIVGSCACLVLSAAFALEACHRTDGSPGLGPGGRINPNEASVASLTRLPGIGLTRARAIVLFRNRLRTEQGRDPAFRNAEDLAQIKGVGPATIDGMRAWLRFDVPSNDGNDPTVP
jgi:competence ComEA-like helix-hairpin-helix protein